MEVELGHHVPQSKYLFKLNPGETFVYSPGAKSGQKRTVYMVTWEERDDEIGDEETVQIIELKTGKIKWVRDDIVYPVKLKLLAVFDYDKETKA